MISHIYLFSFLSLLADVGYTAQVTATTPLETRNVPVETLSKLWDFKGCSEPEKKAIKDGLTEANTILRSPGSSDIGNHWEVCVPRVLYDQIFKLK